MGGYGEEFSLDDADGDIVELEVVAYVFLLEIAPMVPDRGVDLIEEEGNLSPH